MAKNLVGKNYADMSDKYKSKYSKKEFKEARREQRMAGEALEADTPVAAEASESVKDAAAKSKGGQYQKGQQHYSKGELVDTGAPNKDYPGQDSNPYTVKKIENFDLAAGGAGASKGTNRLSAQDMKRLHEQGGFSKQEIVDYAENHDFGDGPGASGGKAQALLGKYKDAIKANQKEEKAPKQDPVIPKPEVTPKPSPEPTEERKIPVGGGMMGDDNFYTSQDQEQETEVVASGENSNAVGGQQVNTAPGGGSQSNQIAGDNNTVTNTQTIDNSVDNSRVYEGSDRTFTYNPSPAPTAPTKDAPLGTPAQVDTPVSLATMGGFYDVDDSPAANASRVDRQSDQNAQLQEKYSDTSNIAQNAIDNASKNAYIDPAALDKRVSASAQNMFDMSTVMGANIFGDMFAAKPPTWNSPKPAEKVETPDFSKLYKTYTEF